jgi:UDP-N-acetylmuramoyl-tripeptide--D-alanyl-D-alanine ligase
MKELCKKIVRKILKSLARSILLKYQPDIIGVTGSVGKTSTKEAVYSVLSNKFRVKRNIKNYNNEIGLPLTIIGADSGGRSIWSWVGVFVRALQLLTWHDKDYPNILILEMAVDRPGDMKYLTDLAPCKIGAVTNVGPVHLEFFKSLERIAKEKSVLVTHIDKNGWAILNCDDELVCQMRDGVKGRVLTYGISNEADVQASDIGISRVETNGEALDDLSGLHFKLSYDGSIVPVLLPNILGEHLVYAALVGATVGIAYGMNLVEISQSLGKFVAPKGRMNIIYGIKDTYIIDDTYNAGPVSTVAGLKVLKKIDAFDRKVAVLGDMLELGTYTEEGHRLVGKAVYDCGVDLLITVGERAKDIADEAKRQGMDEDNIFSFSDNGRAGRFVQDRIKQGDVILVKGSQGMRMEKVVKEIMAEPLSANDLLVRQGAAWKN